MPDSNDALSLIRTVPPFQPEATVYYDFLPAGFQIKIKEAP